MLLQKITTGCCILLHVLHASYAQTDPFFQQGKCKLEQDISFTGNTVDTVSVQTAADCCTACHLYLGTDPCRAFQFTPLAFPNTGGSCALLSKHSATQQQTGAISGWSAQQLFHLEREDATPAGLSPVSQISQESVRGCALHCLQTSECLSFAYMPSGSCSLFTQASWQISGWDTLAGNQFYAIEYNFIVSATPKDCELSAPAQTACTCASSNGEVTGTITYTQTITSGAEAGGERCPSHLSYDVPCTSWFCPSESADTVN